MIFHENCLLADNSHETSYLIFSKFGLVSQDLSSAAVNVPKWLAETSVSHCKLILNYCVMRSVYLEIRAFSSNFGKRPL